MTVSTYTGYTDEPIDSIAMDTLGITEHVGALVKFISECQTPITISIQGDWGSGKTSMMRMVREQLGKKAQTIWFNTWQFSQFDMQDRITMSLLYNFLDELEEEGQLARSILTKIGTTVWRGMGHIAKTGTELVIGAGSDIIKSAFEKLQGNEEFDPVKQIKNIKAQIEKAVEDSLKKKDADRLVVFIDDLDRLLPEKAVELLETLKIFLDIKKCVFVLAIDYQVVTKGLKKKFDVSIDDLKGRSFFDKIIQVPYNLPVQQYTTHNYLKKLLEKSPEVETKEFDIYQRLIEHSLGVNPRGMKRLFNTLQLLTLVAETKKMMIDEPGIATANEKRRILFAMLCLQTSFPSVYEIFLRKREQIDQEFFDSFNSLEVLQTQKYYEEVAKGFRREGVIEPDKEHLVKLIKFMEYFSDAIQLSSDQEDAQESLSQKELDNLRRFLSFSALTSTTSSGGESAGGDDNKYRYGNLLNGWIENDLKQLNEQVKIFD